MEIMKRLVREEEGQGLVEYVMIVAVVVAIGIAINVTNFGSIISTKLLELINKAPGTAAVTKP